MADELEINSLNIGGALACFGNTGVKECIYKLSEPYCPCAARGYDHEVACQVIDHFLGVSDKHPYKLGYIGSGEYHDAWIVIPDEPYVRKDAPSKPALQRFVVRIRKGRMHGGVRLQVRNEVGARRWVCENLKSVPCPEVYGYHDGLNGSSDYTVSKRPELPLYIVEEYVEGKLLRDTWRSDYTFEQQEDIIRKLAGILFDLAATRFEAIAGLDPDNIGELTPHVEYVKAEYMRFAVLSPDQYDIGPYKSVQDHIRAMFDKEIRLCAEPDYPEMLDRKYKSSITIKEFQEFLGEMRDSRRIYKHFWEESFALAHHDISGRNILMQGTKIVALIDWEWAAISPISEFWYNMGYFSQRRGLWLGDAVPGRINVEENIKILTNWRRKKERFDLNDNGDEDAYWTLRVQKQMLAKAKAAGWSGIDMAGVTGVPKQPAPQQVHRFFHPKDMWSIFPKAELLKTRAAKLLMERPAGHPGNMPWDQLQIGLALPVSWKEVEMAKRQADAQAAVRPAMRWVEFNY